MPRHKNAPQRPGTEGVRRNLVVAEPRAKRASGAVQKRRRLASDCLRRLFERLRTSEAFPHEIGLFLGYPPEDVEGFIAQRTCAKCVGCWKVYGDVERAQRLFARYAHCTDIYLRKFAQGRDIERLTVAV